MLAIGHPPDHMTATLHTTDLWLIKGDTSVYNYRKTANDAVHSGNKLYLRSIQQSLEMPDNVPVYIKQLKQTLTAQNFLFLK